MSEERVDLWDVTLRVRREGAGPPVLLLHGHAGTLDAWDDLAALLAAEHTVVRPDLRGYGGSGRDTGGPWPALVHEMVLDNLALMHSLGHDTFAVVGRDLGGHVAARLALEHPTKVTRLVVVDAVPLPPPTCPTLVLWSGGAPFTAALRDFLDDQAR
ncbi:alpha/beta fold hydrolase [Dactylosporangium aurantiacum]|uniref:Alpha/beta fold hydrolase n=1 Tax=Dactylosporangium aurantiacum TaxID=35754 RepID=A0A9Q9MFK4_9ACTN|nr:alpha/beta fold hydrolase [Dactylosporangium aurantiacum]MDG6109049.1 alpha/beta fold hydrolase [Dactylosporangium aurantiacum]UWZ54549.1 alpha/beta fold hydrolase [Dactylosporangium aurantiacum]